MSLPLSQWGTEYGPIYQCNLVGTNHVWISSDKIAQDLLGKRRAIFSDRPFIPALEQDNRTSGQYLPLMSKNEKWTRQRKFGKQIMAASHKASYYNYPELESVRMLFELMQDSKQYNHHMESFVARVTSRLAWGTSTPAEELKQRARELLIGVSPTGALGNKLPVIMRLPEKFSPAKAWEARRSRTERKFLEMMQQEVRETLNKDAASPKQSWTQTFLDNTLSWSFSSHLEGAYAVGMHGIAGALTVAAPMQSFCLALCYYPQYQPLLHEEIDRVLGNRMPTFQDMPDMPVLRAFIRETLRWRPPVPTGIPHECTEDNVYEGYFIPKGSVVHPLEWSISRDPAMFPEPDAWNPLRWLNSEYPTYQEPLSHYPSITAYSQFGYGARTCQGRGVVEADLFVGIGSVAWLFSIESQGASANEIASRSDTNATFVSDPETRRSGTSAKNTPVATDTRTTPPSNGSLGNVTTAASRSALLSTVPTTGSSAPIKSSDGSYDADPTMNFSSLLIAKPLPFTFDMKVRSRDRADLVLKEWVDLFMQGEFERERTYWKEDANDERQYGWGEVFS